MDELFVDLTDLVDQRMAALGEGQRRTLVHPSGFVYPASRAATQADGMFMTSDGPCLDTPCGACGSPPVVATNSDVGLAEAAASCAVRLAVCSQLCDEMRARLHAEVGITTSAGISVSKLLSKLVASEHKPQQQTLLVPLPDTLARLLPPSLPVSKIPGIGFAATRRWQDAGVHSIDELLVATEAEPTPPAVDPAVSVTRGLVAHMLSRALILHRPLSRHLDTASVMRVPVPKKMFTEFS